MFLRLFRRAPADRRPAGTVFRYHDGTRERSADPVAAWYALDDAAGRDKWQELLRAVAQELPPVPPGQDPAKFAKVHKAAESARRAATVELADAVCRAFGVAPLAPDGTGLTLTERVALAASYLEFMGGLAGLAKAHPTTASPARTA